MSWTRSLYLQVLERARSMPKAYVTDTDACSACGIRPVDKGWDNFCRNCGSCFVPAELLAAGELSRLPEISG